MHALSLTHTAARRLTTVLFIIICCPLCVSLPTKGINVLRPLVFHRTLARPFVAAACVHTLLSRSLLCCALRSSLQCPLHSCSSLFAVSSRLPSSCALFFASRPKKCALECKKNCPVNRAGK